MKRKKTIIRCILGGGIALALLLAGRKVDKPWEVEVAAVKRGDISESIPCGGKIRPVREIVIAAEVSGEIVWLPVSDGKPVRRGDVLLKIRQDAYLAALESAEASLGMLRAELIQHESSSSLARIELDRIRNLVAGEAVPRNRLEKAEAEKSIADARLEAARCAVERGEAAVREAEDNLARTVIVAPMDGNVSRLSVKTGERIVGTSQMAGTPVMRITDFSEMELVVNVGENDAVRIHEGDSAEISLEAYGGRKFHGIVTKIANSAKLIDGSFGQVTNFEVRIAMLGESYADLLESDRFPVRPGMSATAAIKTSEASGILKVPAQSLFTSRGSESVWRVENGRVYATAIRTGIQDLDYTGVTEGLQEGDLVVTAPAQAVSGGLEDGVKVKIKN